MNTKQTNYTLYKEGILEKRTFLELHGISVENFTSKDDLRKKPFWPFIHCICVQDTPENPCPCNEDFIIWIPTKDILDIKKSGKKNQEDKNIYVVRLNVNAEVQVEFTLPISVKKLFDTKSSGKCGCESGSQQSQKRMEGFSRFCKNLNPNPLDIGWYTMCDCIAETDNSIFKCIADYINDRKGI
ncbi:MAG TPA: hypothetical protein VIZ28_16855 [Chitinophagaceae bacterium]